MARCARSAPAADGLGSPAALAAVRSLLDVLHCRAVGGPEITRRDFLNGTRIAVTGAALSPWVELFGAPAPAFAAEDPFPPARTGLRGSHDGAWEVAHALVSGQRFEATAASRRESVDLVVVGAGISGLAAAWFYRKARPDARILILDNHDDFGGHAKRNEFEAGGRTLSGYGGTEAIDGSDSYCAVSRERLRELGLATG